MGDVGRDRLVVSGWGKAIYDCYVGVIIGWGLFFSTIFFLYIEGIGIVLLEFKIPPLYIIMNMVIDIRRRIVCSVHVLNPIDCILLRQQVRVIRIRVIRL